MKKNAIIFSISSDIGYEIALMLQKEGYTIYGTYNNFSEKINTLLKLGMKLYQCNLLHDQSINHVIKLIKNDCKVWHSLFLLQASMNPIGKLTTINMEEWEKSLKLNFINQIKIITQLLDIKAKENSCVITFAGGGTNSATKNFSAYTISKIALIKMMELLYEENKDVKFTCIGPGWVKTKIHQETLNAKNNAYDAYKSTIEHLNNDDFTNIQDILECILWILNEKIDIVSGRNFSVIHDSWGKEKLNNELLINQNMYKLRREGNQWKI